MHALSLNLFSEVQYFSFSLLGLRMPLGTDLIKDIRYITFFLKALRLINNTLKVSAKHFNYSSGTFSLSLSSGKTLCNNI